jgi:transcriptional repressor NrdR
MDFLKRTDPIAYIRFASVYRSFTDLHEFLDEIQDFIEKSATDPNAAE